MNYVQHARRHLPGGTDPLPLPGQPGVTAETLFLDTSNSLGVTSTVVLTTGIKYSIVVQGTWNGWNHILTTGTPNADAMFPGSTAGRVSTEVGIDAECAFAVFTGGGVSLGHKNWFSINLGSGYSYVTPTDGAHSTPSPGYTYTYEVVGQGSVVSFVILGDTVYTDNYGKLRIVIQSLDPTGSSGTGSLLPPTDPAGATDESLMRVISGVPTWDPQPAITEADLNLSDVTTANASTSKHGLLRKLSGAITDVLRGDGTFGTFAASVFGRTGAVVAANGDYYGVVAAALTGAVQAARFVGATASGAPGSGTFLLGDFVIAQNGHVFVCTVAGSPGTWVDAGGTGLASPLTTKGDLWGYTSTDARVPIGTDNFVLTADSTQTRGLKWASVPSAVPTGTYVLADHGGEETVDTIATAGASQTLDLANGNVFDLTLTAAACTLTLTGATASKMCAITLVIRQDATGGRTITWPGSVSWVGSGVAPILQTAPSAVDTVVLFTVDGGTTWQAVAQSSASGLRSGTSFPGSPSDGDLFYRTDRRILYEYLTSITKWLSLDRKYVAFTGARFLNASGSTGVWGWVPLFEDVYVETFVATFHLGATNSGTAFWTANFVVEDVASGGGTTVGSVSTSADAVSVNATHTFAYNTLVAAATHPNLLVTIAKTGAPTAPDFAFMVVLRSVG